MNYLMLSQMGLDLAGSFGNFASARIEADMARSMQEYRNTMAALSAARSKNAITINEIRTLDASAQQDELIQRTSMQDKARAEVNAAAAGVKGNTIDMIATDLNMSAQRAQYARERQLSQQLSEMGEQRKSVALDQLMSKDTQVIPKPSIGSLLLGSATSLMQIQQSHQPESNRLLR